MGRIKRLSITFTIIVLTAVLSIRLASLFAAPNNDGFSVIDLFSEKREVDGASILGASDENSILGADGASISETDGASILQANGASDQGGNFFQEGADVLENQYKTNIAPDGAYQQNGAFAEDELLAMNLMAEEENDSLPVVNEEMLEAQKGQDKDDTPAPASATKVAKTTPDPITGESEKYPIDLKNPNNIETVVEYDFATGNYIIHTKIGDIDIATPLVLTPDEYKERTLKEQMARYWDEKNADALSNYESKFNITDMKFSLGPAEKIFGPGGVQVKTQGSAELSFGIKHNNIQNYSLAERLRKTTVPDFNEKIQLNVNAKVGEKIGFTMNYNTEATFDFDQQLLKLNYNGNEDEIIKSIDVGNVSLPLNSTLIKGSSALFGLKTELQFGKLNIVAVVSQQQSETQHVNSQGGAQLMDFEVDIDNYDENRHFFLAHFFRDNYDKNMQKLPYITSGVTITRCEVWVTNKRGNFDQARNIVAFMDLGEQYRIDNNHWNPLSTVQPDNSSNNLYDEVKDLGIRDIQNCNSILDNAYNMYGILGGEDYEKIESARRLEPSEYTLNTQLGYISLRTALNSDEVLAVAYEYTYNGKTYQVGEFSTDGINAPNALILKLLKGTATSPQTALWDLMMKNIYYLGGNQIQQEKFKLNIQYKNDSSGVYVNYINEGPIKNQLLIRVMNLDRLDSRNEQSPDGKFDFVENYTIYSSSGRLIFPVVEPFGSHLRKMLNNEALADKYCYDALYDSTKIAAQEMTEKNKFRIAGEYQASSGNVIRLNAMNVPRGSVVVTAGGQTLMENVDYTVDYTMGTVTILNQSILASGNNIDVQLESQSMFNLQRKTLVGTHVEYAFTKDFTVGATLMHLSEMPLVTKTQMGSEPIANTLWGMNAAYRNDAPWLTKAIDAIPGINATAPSNIAINAEFAQMIPGHRKIRNNPGYAYLDDFESAETTIDLRYPYYWHLASTPYDPSAGALFPEASLVNNIEYGYNRAIFNWYSIDNTVFNRDGSQMPTHLRKDKNAWSSHLTREVREQELFPNRDQILGESAYLTTLNLSFYPNERGPYNLDLNVDPTTGNLLNPEKRWGGMMRKLETTDFETANIEYIEFWMMDPFVYDSLNRHSGGDLYINFGDVSEDVLRDGKKFFENGMPANGDTTLTENTVWGRVPKQQSTVLAFDGTLESRQNQDVGLNGLSTENEKKFYTYYNFTNQLRNKLTPAAIQALEDDPFSALNDPASDNYHHYRGSDYDNVEMGILERYKRYNNTEGNSPASDISEENYSTSATTVPDAEDINKDNTLNEYEKYFQYRISIRHDDMEPGKNNIVDKVRTSVTLANGQISEVDWYLFKIPIRDYEKRVGAIRDFKSIRFMRIFMTGFKETTHLRFGTLELVRGDWRGYKKDLYPIDMPPTTTASIDVSSVNIEENSNKEPVNYVLPPGVTRQTDPNQTQITQQNEQALLMKVLNLAPSDARAVYKNITYDMRMYKHIQMFVHAEQIIGDDSDLRDYETTVFMRIGSDHTMNYYEYEIPLKLTPAGHYTTAERVQVWPEENMFDFDLERLTSAKNNRNKRIRGTGESMSVPYYEYDETNKKNKITVVGNPNLGEIRTIMIGVRNQSRVSKNVEVWVNELRLSNFDESSGWGAMANMAINLSDVGAVNIAGRYETAGFGGIEETLQQRRLDNLGQFNISAQFDFGRFFPEKAAVRIPVYYSYGLENSKPKYNPLDEDVLLTDALSNLETQADKDSLLDMAVTKNITESFNITNMKVDIKSKTPKIWDPSNFSASFAYTKNQLLDPETDRDFAKSYIAQFHYNFSTSPRGWEPFKDNKKVKVKLLKEFALRYEPTMLAMSINLNRQYAETQLRDLTGAMIVDNYDPTNSLFSFSKDFTWSRNMDLKYDMTKNLKFSLTTTTNSRYDETKFKPVNRKFFPDEYEEWKDTIRRSVAGGGRPLDYQQTFTASWDVPINKIPYLEFLTLKGQYNATYTWATGVTYDGDASMGNTITNLAQWQVDGQANFETFYNKFPYLKKVNQRFSGRKRTRRGKFTPRTYSQEFNLTDTADVVIKHRLNSDKMTISFIDADSATLKLRYKKSDKNTIIVKGNKNIEKVRVNIETIDPNTETAGELAAASITRFFMLIRRLQVAYKESSTVTIPGFEYGGRFFGQSMHEKMMTPGLDFSFGVPQESYLEKAMQNGWLVMNDSIVNPALTGKTTDFDARLNLEPAAGLKIEVNVKHMRSNQSSIQYQYDGMPTTYSGNFRMTYCALGTMFQGHGKIDDNYKSAAFEQMLENRAVIAQRLQEKYTGAHYPTTGFMEGSALAGAQYKAENGTYNMNSADVIIPAFLAAYTGRSPNKISTNIFPGLLSMLPNWKVTYDGLGKIKGVDKYFRSITINHAYQCTYNIGSYSSYSNYAETEDGFGFVRDITTGNPIPSSPYDIASVSITENLSPLIAVDVAMKNSLTAKLEFRKQRVLTLNIASNQLLEATNNEWVVGVGYVLKDFDMILKLKGNKTKKVKNDLTLRLDFSFKDISTLLRKLDAPEETQATSGNKTVTIKFAADYVFSSKLNFKLFADYQSNSPYITTSYPMSNLNIGVSVKFMLTQ